MLDYRIKLTNGEIVRPIRLECGAQVAIYKKDDKEFAVTRSGIIEFLFDKED